MGFPRVRDVHDGRATTSDFDRFTLAMSSLPPTNGSREQLIYYRSHSGGYSVNPVWLAACKTLASASSKEEGALHSVTLIPHAPLLGRHP